MAWAEEKLKSLKIVCMAGPIVSPGAGGSQGVAVHNRGRSPPKSGENGGRSDLGRGRFETFSVGSPIDHDVRPRDRHAIQTFESMIGFPFHLPPGTERPAAVTKRWNSGAATPPSPGN